MPALKGKRQWCVLSREYERGHAVTPRARRASPDVAVSHQRRQRRQRRSGFARRWRVASELEQGPRRAAICEERCRGGAPGLGANGDARRGHGGHALGQLGCPWRRGEPARGVVLCKVNRHSTHSGSCRSDLRLRALRRFHDRCSGEQINPVSTPHVVGAGSRISTHTYEKWPADFR